MAKVRRVSQTGTGSGQELSCCLRVRILTRAIRSAASDQPSPVPLSAAPSTADSPATSACALLSCCVTCMVRADAYMRLLLLLLSAAVVRVAVIATATSSTPSSIVQERMVEGSKQRAAAGDKRAEFASPILNRTKDGVKKR